MRHCKTNCAFVQLGFPKRNIKRVGFAAPTSGLVFTVVVVVLFVYQTLCDENPKFCSF